MIRTIGLFVRGILTLAWPWWVWLGVLLAVNFIGPLLFFGSLEAKVVLAALALAAAIQFVIVARLGYVRLLGAGHIVAWVPMLLWLVPRLAVVGSGTLFGRWLVAVAAVDLASLAIDFVDVGRYLAGDRRPAPGTSPQAPAQTGGER